MWGGLLRWLFEGGYAKPGEEAPKRELYNEALQHLKSQNTSLNALRELAKKFGVSIDHVQVPDISKRFEE